MSTDRGDTFRALSFEQGERAERVLTRADDTLVTQTFGPRGRVTRISTDLGATFRETIPVPPLTRLGNLVFGFDSSCGFSPTWPLLAASGSFVSAKDSPGPDWERRVENLSRWFVVSPTAVIDSSEPMPWADDLEVPATITHKYPGFPVCDPATGHLHPHRRTKLGKMLAPPALPEAAPCAGIACVRGARVARRPPTVTSAYLLLDGPRHALFVTDRGPAREEVRSVALPTGCEARFVTFSSGLVLLACGSSIHAATREGRWVEEWKGDATRSFSVDDFEMTADGTAMLATFAAEDARAIVRSPSAIGGAPWRDVTRKGAVDYALRSDGIVEVLVGEDDLLTVTEDAPTGPLRELLSNVRIGGDLWCLGHKDNRFVGLRRNPTGTFERILLAPNRVTLEGPALDGSGAMDPSGACGF